MSKQKKITLTIVAVVVLALVLLCGLTVYISVLPQFIGDQETVILGQSRFVPGSQAALRVAVRDVRDASPVTGAALKVSMRPQSGGKAVVLFEGTTNEHGTADVSFQVPETEDPAQNLIIETRSDLGRDELERPVTVKRDYKVLLTTDKPLYQPGQIIHIRALALGAFDLHPAEDQTVEFVVADGKGNKVFRKKVTTSQYGIAAVDFVLADEVNTGRYKISAELEKTSSERTVTVQHYVLPKFKMDVETDKSFYRPGDLVSGKMTVYYFFGKPVEEGQVTIEGYTFDIERQQAINIQGKTDEEGVFEFEFTLPDYFVASGLEGGISQFIMEIAVQDQAEHIERTALSLPVAQESIVIEAVPESGELKPGVENIVYVATVYPDGAPAQCDVTVNAEGQTFRLTTGEYGLGELRLTPNQPHMYFVITARDEMGHTATLEHSIEGRWDEEYVLLRPERVSYRVGETMHLEVFTSAPVGTAYLDIVREGQTVSTRSLDIKDGRAEADVDLTADMFGTLELHAYKILTAGNITRDTRLVVVDAANDLSLAITGDQDTYLPGGTAAISFQVSDIGGQPVPAAIGISVVDEALFALAEQDPGFAKIYFLLEKELQQPKYQIKGFTWGQVMREDLRPSRPDLREAQDTSAKAALALAAERSFSLSANSHDEKEQLIQKQQQSYFKGVAKAIFPFTLLLPLGMALLTLVSIREGRVIGLSLMISLLLLLIFACFLTIIPVPGWYGPSLLDKLGYLLGEASEGLLCLAPIALLSGLVGLIVLAVHAVREPDRPLGWKLLLLLAYIILLPLLIYALIQANQEPDEGWVIVFLIAYLLISASFVVRGVGFGVKRRAGMAVAAFLAAGFAFVGPIAGPVLIGPAVGGVFSGVVSSYSAPGMQRDLAVPIAPMAAGMPSATPAPMPTAVAEEKGAGARAGAEAEQQEMPRLRQYFPEALYWNPEAVTDENGHLTLEIPMADSITTWRLTALASAQEGQLGSATAGIRVFQDFFVDIDLPVYFTQGDEVSVPIAVYNYLPQPQTVQLTLTQEDWFELLDEAEKELFIESDDVEVVYFRIRVVQFGTHSLTMTALGEHMSDAIRRSITVYPDGKQLEATFSDRLEEPVEKTVTIPAEAINGTANITCKIYPGVLSQVVEGLETLLRLPHG
jgi:5-hydroxyisourate hydrolase-like protein (transthyretin family)